MIRYGVKEGDVLPPLISATEDLGDVASLPYYKHFVRRTRDRVCYVKTCLQVMTIISRDFTLITTTGLSQ